MNRWKTRTLASLLSVVALATLAAGCASVPKRNTLPKEYVSVAEIPGIPAARVWGDSDAEGYHEFMEKSDEEIRAEFSGIYDRAHTYLAISGGGANGAFGAGLLAGWTAAGDRPEFTLVTGISTGALIAPFAFLGPEYDDVLEDFYTTTTTKDILRKRCILNTLTSDAAASSEPLQALLEEVITPEVVEKIAAEHRIGRQLFIGTTNLDAQRPVIWEVGKIAASGEPGAIDLIRQVLLASASIPGAFPPVLIEVEVNGETYDELHVDGGAASQVFVYPADIHWDQVIEKLRVPGRPRVYVIRNSRLDPEWTEVKNKLFTISGRSVASMIRTQGIGDLYQIYLKTLRDGLEFRLAHIPSDFNEPKNEQFDPVYMKALFDVGYDLAKSGYPWEEEPPGWELFGEDVD
jgi:predicted acylesterase/phospholipase RssA